ncbi:putative ABC transporter ATP-binding protein [Rubripirellula lacrimiformis]|uniref:Energy-dependent translational throttle protein EttA n=1 Tax=Rubripirellula lacrimiformis TaxID=1930273 RepID=A0A517N897_9BACT|nr:energy-dependent translational throttle protein EttA [Rubripirellula lacrimiformis]QDT03365.1 putative ABC transporter ATP-binding protein [Rubripirellula lacrimiformis]
MSRHYIYQVENLVKKHGQKVVLDDVCLAFYPGAKIGVLGPNGAGKSTLMKIMAGKDTEFEGVARLAKDATVGYLEQEPPLDETKTVFENVQEAVKERQAILDRYNEISVLLGEVTDDDEMQKLCDEMAKLQDTIDAANLWELDRHVEMSMAVMNLPPADSSVKNLSGGEKRRIALCQLLIRQPDLLLLDEPTNHLDAESVSWLEQHLAKYPGTVVAVTHDRYFLDNVAQWILEIDRGQGIPFEGNYTAWLEAREKRMQIEKRQAKARDRMLSRELEWIRMSPKARQTKSKARIKAYEEMSAQKYDEQNGELEIQIPPGRHLGDLVIEAKEIKKGYGDRVLMENLSFRLPPGGIVGVIGPNGAGKTTLFKMLTGQEEPDAGSFKVGDTVDLGYVDQSRDSLDAGKTVFQEISGGTETIVLGGRNVNARSYVSKFNFKGPDQEKKVGILSGGERNRVHLAKLLRSGCNVLLLDEPTNDLDVDTLRSLEEAIANFAGCVVVTSHDRWFLDRLATHILAFEGDGKLTWCEGNFDTYERNLRERMGLNPDDEEAVSKSRYKSIHAG